MYIFFCLVFYCYPAAFGLQDEFDVEAGWVSGNEIFDSIIKDIRDHTIDLRNFSSVSLPMLEKGMQTMGDVGASLTASVGVLSDLTSVRRVGDVRLRSHGDSVLVYAPVTLDDLRIVFHHYTLRLGFLPKSGDRLALNVGKSVFDAVFEVHFQGQGCSLTLQGLKVSEMKHMKVDISGFSVFNFVGRLVATWFVEYFKEMVHEIAETYGKNTVNNVMEDMGICEQVLDKTLFTMADDIGEGGSFQGSSLQTFENDSLLESIVNIEDEFLRDNRFEDFIMSVKVDYEIEETFEETFETEHVDSKRVEQRLAMVDCMRPKQDPTKYIFKTNESHSDIIIPKNKNNSTLHCYPHENVKVNGNLLSKIVVKSVRYLDSIDGQTWLAFEKFVTVYFIFLIYKKLLRNVEEYDK